MEQDTSTSVAPQPSVESAAHEKSIRLKIGLFGFFLFIVFVVGLFWLATTPEQTVGLTLSFVAGLSMIFLPCTLPLAFVIVPLTMGKDPKKGLLMALSFTLGLTITLSIYGVFIAAVGRTFGLKSDAEVYAVLLGGTAAFLIGLSEIGLLKFKLPSYSGKFPDFIQRRKDYMKTFLLGLLLGNAGVGCPNPAFYLLLGYIATVGDLFNGWFLGFVHGLGRSVPLIFLAILGTLGINALSGVTKHKEGIERSMGWMLVIIGSYLLTFGIFGHDWFIASGIHGAWEQFVNNIGGERFGEVILKHEHQLVDVPNFIQYGNMFWLGFLALTFLVAFIIKKPSRRTILSLSVIYIVIALVVGYSTAWTFKLGTQVHVQFKGAAAEPHGGGEESAMGGAHKEEHGETLYHEEREVKSGPTVNLNITPVPFGVGQAQKLDFFVNEKPGNIPVTDLEIEHEKYMHVIGVRSDMNEFFHIHPVRAEVLPGNEVSIKEEIITPGTGFSYPSPPISPEKRERFIQKTEIEASSPPPPRLFIIDYTFKKPGLYKIWSEIKKDGVNHSFGHPEILVIGEGLKEDKKISFGRNVIVGQYQVALNLDEPVVKGHEHDLSFDVHTFDGDEVEVEDYLAAPMHLTIIKDDWKQFIHTHPADDMHAENMNGLEEHRGSRIFSEVLAHGDEELPGETHEEGVADETINFHAVFPEAGLYKAFAQFRPKGTDLPLDDALIAGFWIKVEEKAPPLVSSWWINLIWSLIAIVVLSVLVKKYLKKSV